MTRNNGVYILELWNKFCCYREFLCMNSRSLTNFTFSTRMYQKENILAYIIVVKKLQQQVTVHLLYKLVRKVYLPCSGYIWKVIYSEYIALPHFFHLPLNIFKN